MAHSGDKTTWVYAVVLDRGPATNRFLYEVQSLWWNKEEAIECAEAMVGPWRVVAMLVYGEGGGE